MENATLLNVTQATGVAPAARRQLSQWQKHSFVALLEAW